MGRTAVFKARDGNHYSSIGGRHIKKLDPARHFIVAEDLHAEYRATKKRGDGKARPPAPKAPSKLTINDSAKAVYNYTKREHARDGNPHDGFANVKTAKMWLKLRRADPDAAAKFLETMRSVGSRYYKYSAASHSFEMYTHKQVHLGAFQLPESLRSKKAIYPIQHYKRKTYPKGENYTAVTYGAPSDAAKAGRHRPPAPNPRYM